MSRCSSEAMSLGRNRGRSGARSGRRGCALSGAWSGARNGSGCVLLCRGCSISSTGLCSGVKSLPNGAGYGGSQEVVYWSKQQISNGLLQKWGGKRGP